MLTNNACHIIITVGHGLPTSYLAMDNPLQTVTEQSLGDRMVHSEYYMTGIVQELR